MMKTAAHNDLLPVLEEEIRRFESDRIVWLHFTPEVESRYARETGTSRARILVTQGLFSVLVYDFFLVGDYFMAPEHILRAAIVRLGIVTPVAMLAAFAVRSLRSAVLREVSVALCCLLGALGVLFLHHDVNQMVSIEGQVGIMLILLVMNCLLRLEPIYALSTSLLVAAADLLWLRNDAHLPVAHKLVLDGMMAWAVMLTVAANYAITRERRFSFLLQLRGWLQRGMLAAANAELVALSSTDRLTGLPNRRAYDIQLPKVWAMAVESRSPLSAVMVDVDHFKRLNDTYGHPYGDRVLQRVASLLQQALRGEEDFVARFGGEEFIVLLPNTDAAAALKVAERIRTLVQVAGSPALQRDSNAGQDVWATVSCGVATVWPASGGDASHVIASADTAMYRAKQEGRNRVCSAPAVPSPARLTIFPGGAARA